jgi:hypothetical protein
MSQDHNHRANNLFIEYTTLHTAGIQQKRSGTPEELFVFTVRITSLQPWPLTFAFAESLIFKN